MFDNLSSGGKGKGSKTGKAVRLKCDEAKPECFNCRGKGVKCGGYGRKLQWSMKHQVNYATHKSAWHKSRGCQTRSAGLTMRPAEIKRDLLESGERLTPSDLTGNASKLVEAPFDASFLLHSDSAFEFVNHEPDDQLLYTPDLDNEQPWDTDPTVRLLDFGSMSESHLSPPPQITAQTHHVLAEEKYSSDAIVSLPAARDKVHRVPRNILNIPSLLITRWFEQVCPIWSAFDSEISLNRTLAKRLWGESEAVLTSLQSMSAAYMSNQAPQMKATAFQYMQAAMNAITSEILVLNTRVVMRTLPVGVLFALVCMGTIFGWINRHELVKRLLKNTKAILSEAKLHSQNFSPSDREMLSFFVSSTQYWDTLVTFMGVEDESGAAVGDDNSEDTMLHFDINGNGSQCSTLTPHPWTGISTMTSQLFCESIKCCRSFRKKMRGDEEGHTSLLDALDFMAKAEQLEIMLKQLEYPNLDEIGETGDRLTPRQHLIEAAEAYRLSALLHLYQTFPNTSTEVSPIGSFEIARDDVIWGDRVVPLALYLTDLLKKIPPESGSRSLLPILYIAASTGLRFRGGPSNLQLTAGLGDSSGLSADNAMTYDLSDLSWTSPHGSFDAFTSVSEDIILIGDARHLIMQRLGLLENCLYPKPIEIAKNLVKAIWEAYDNDIFDQHDVHWADIMEDLGLRSIFG
ncbi:unnamed protein product [Clonostachys rosea f. rosea IK726]|uniref:Uncharacterized protein n=1 Tax=Clonostachys rosea f. rosea IK726 TaxID=1349383 RepID=A0ACA9U674_BIOOC|nr:unnamed protein product [Clonostachys rosea f. rosea IK726]